MKRVKNQDETVIVSKRRHKEAGNRDKAERQGKKTDKKDRRQMRKAQTGFVLISGAGKAEES